MVKGRLVQRDLEFRLGIGKPDDLADSHLATRPAHRHRIAGSYLDDRLQVSQTPATQDGPVRRYEIFVKQ